MIERVVALAVLAASGVYLANALPLPQGTPARPGPGLFPVAVGVFGVLVAVTWLVSAFRRAPTVEGPSIVTDARGRVICTAVALVGFCLVLPWLGYALGSFLFAGLLLRWLGAGWKNAFLIGFASAVASYYLFAVALGVPLPHGVWFD